jgi:hypothetical protein
MKSKGNLLIIIIEILYGEASPSSNTCTIDTNFIVANNSNSKAEMHSPWTKVPYGSKTPSLKIPFKSESQ